MLYIRLHYVFLGSHRSFWLNRVDLCPLLFFFTVISGDWCVACLKLIISSALAFCVCVCLHPERYVSLLPLLSVPPYGAPSPSPPSSYPEQVCWKIRVVFSYVHKECALGFHWVAQVIVPLRIPYRTCLRCPIAHPAAPPPPKYVVTVTAHNQAVSKHWPIRFTI